MANIGFTTMYDSKKVSASDCNTDNNRQPEKAIWPPKPEILISLELTDSVEIPTANSGFSTITRSTKVQDKRTNRNGNISIQNVYIAICGCRSLWQSPEDTFIDLVVVENPRFVGIISIISVVIP